MNDALPLVTVVIAARPGQAEVPSLTAARQFDYPADKLEIIVARGKQPSVQRNTAVRAAKGEWIYFLDDDSVAAPANLRRALRHLSDAAVCVIGGPNTCPESAPGLEHAFAGAMSNKLAFGPSAARYRPIGAVRPTTEKELILCNLLMKRSAFLAAGGFDEALYPNEENALLDTLVAKGGKLLYDPEMVVERRPRPTVKAFIKMLLNYGRGRAEQFRLHPGLGSVLNFVPPLFCLYLLVAAWLPVWLLAPLALYVLLVGASVISQPRSARASVPRIALFVVLTHIFYGLGFWRGLFTRLAPPGQRPKIDVELQTIPPA